VGIPNTYKLLSEKKIINLNISRFLQKEKLLYIYKNLTKIERYLY